MPEPHPRAELHQACLRRWYPRRHRNPQLPGRPPYRERVAGRIGRRELQQPPGLGWQSLELSPEALLDPARQRSRAGQAEPTRQLGRRLAPRQLQQGQRIPPRFADDLIPDPRVQWSSQH